MKKIISMLLVLVMILSAFALTSCDESEGSDVVASSSSEQTTTGQTTSGNSTSVPINVNSVNGKDALALFKAAKEEFSNITSYDAKCDINETVDGETVTYKVVSKLSGINMYLMYVDMDEKITEITVLDNVAYMKYGEQKVKMEGFSEEDIFSNFPNIADYGYFKLNESKFAGLDIYYQNGLYSFTVEFTAKEAIDIDLDAEEEGKIIFYFGADGALKKTHTIQKSYTESEEIISVNRPVTINPPMDVSNYLELGGEGVDQEAYNRYIAVAQKLASENAYIIDYSAVAAESFVYKCDSAGDMILEVKSTNALGTIYYVGGKYYASQGSNMVEASPNQSVISSMSTAANFMSLPASLEKSSMVKMSFLNKSGNDFTVEIELLGEEKLVFEYDDKAGDGSYSKAVLKAYSDNEEIWTVEYNFGYSNFDVVLPK